MKNTAFYPTPLGRIGISESGGAITDVFFAAENRPADGMQENETPVLEEAGRQLSEYWAGGRKHFDLPLAPEGTAFQKAVWAALRDIPYGETRSYKQVALAIGRPGSSRAVGMANHKNPILILTPCHRVVGSDGSLTGFAAGLDVKEALLKLEKDHTD